MGPVWEKSTHIYLPEKQFLHIFTQIIISPRSQPIWWTGKVPTDRDLCTCASYCLKDIGVFFNSWKCWHHAYLYIPLNFKNNRDIRVKIKIWPWIDVHVGKIVDKFNRYFHFVMNKLLFLFYYHYYLHLYQEIYYFLILCLNSGRVVPI